MRKPLFAIMICCLLATSGCMVMDEIDSAAAKMPAAKNKKKKVAASEPTSTGTAVPEKNALLEQTRQWWKSASSLSPANAEPSIVRCRLREGTQFMSKDDCLARGGEPRGVSG